MSAFDKIYGTADQYYEFQRWAAEFKLNYTHSLYPTPEDYPKTSTEFVIVNTSGIEQILLFNCPLEFVKSAIREKYKLPEDHNLVPHYYLDRENIQLFECRFYRSYLFEDDIYYVGFVGQNKYLNILRCSSKEIMMYRSSWFESYSEAKEALKTAAKNKIEELENRIKELQEIVDFY